MFDLSGYEQRLLHHLMNGHHIMVSGDVLTMVPELDRYTVRREVVEGLIADGLLMAVPRTGEDPAVDADADALAQAEPVELGPDTWVIVTGAGRRAYTRPDLATTGGIQDEMERWGITRFRPGTYFTNRHAYRRRVKAVERLEQGKGRQCAALVVRMERPKRDGSGVWEDAGYQTVEKFSKDGWWPLPDDAPTFEQADEMAFDALRNPAKYGMGEGFTMTDDVVTAIAPVSGAEHVRALQVSITLSIERADVLRAMVEARVSALSNVVSEMQDQLKMVTKVVGALEDYLGVNHDITQIAAGEPAGMDVPVTIRQLVLRMDEEVAVSYPHGVDWQKVRDFDEWLADPENRDVVVPEEKCIVAMIVSDRERVYSNNFWHNIELNARNRRLYLIIRNGGNLHRIDMDTQLVGATSRKLYPGLTDDLARLRSLDEGTATRSQARDAETVAFEFRRRVLILQGILDQTELLRPMTHLINLFDEDTYGDQVQLVRDAEVALPSGRMSYKDWRAWMNGHIVKGSLVLLAGGWTSWIHGEYSGRYERYSSNYGRQTWNPPPAPPPGVYQVERVVMPKDVSKYDDRHSRSSPTYIAYYNPKDEVRPGWGADYWAEPHTRKVRLSFRFFASDWQVFHYDSLGLDDLRFYLHNRTDRARYWEVIPTLKELIAQREAELVMEQGLVRLMTGETGCTEEMAWDAIEWWKTVVVPVWKRPITQDDAKAVRMITRRLRQQMKGDERHASKG